MYRSIAKAATTRFFAYATVYTICRNKRVTLAIHAVPSTEILVATLTYLLAIIHPMRMSIKLLCLDRGFYSVPIIRWLLRSQFAVLNASSDSGQNGSPGSTGKNVAVATLFPAAQPQRLPEFLR